MFVKKFLGCIPSRVGCLILAYLGIITSTVVLLYFTTVSCKIFKKYFDAVENKRYSIEYDPGEEKLSAEEEKVAFSAAFGWILVTLASYFFVHVLFVVFSCYLMIGAHLYKRCPVKAYFVYGFLHFFFMLFLAALHACMHEYVSAALYVCVDVFFAFCLCGVKGFLDTINSGQVYTHPGVVHKLYILPK